jgi:hypothetical protein
MSRRARLIVTLAIAAVLVATAGTLAWRWLTPAAATTADLQRLILRFELADAVSWPEDAYGRTRLTSAEEASLKAGYEDAVKASTTGSLERRELAIQPWRFMLKQRASYPRMLTTGAGGRIVYYDFVRRTVSGDLVVRALVQRYADKANWHFRTDKLKRLGRDWWPTGLVTEYRLTKTAAGWRIVAAEALPLQVDTQTGALIHGYP